LCAQTTRCELHPHKHGSDGAAAVYDLNGAEFTRWLRRDVTTLRVPPKLYMLIHAVQFAQQHKALGLYSEAHTRILPRLLFNFVFCNSHNNQGSNTVTLSNWSRTSLQSGSFFWPGRGRSQIHNHKLGLGSPSPNSMFLCSCVRRLPVLHPPFPLLLLFAV
jgi:hypothetical protein